GEQGVTVLRGRRGGGGLRLLLVPHVPRPFVPALLAPALASPTPRRRGRPPRQRLGEGRGGRRRLQADQAGRRRGQVQGNGRPSAKPRRARRRANLLVGSPARIGLRGGGAELRQRRRVPPGQRAVGLGDDRLGAGGITPLREQSR